MYDWGKASDGNGKGDAEQIPAGEHKLKIIKVVFGKKTDGVLEPFLSKSDDPQIMLIFADDQAREASQMVTLSEKAAWVLAGICKAAGMDVQKMTDRGITPDRFADETFATAQLVGRVLTAKVTYNDKGYAEIKPLRPRQGATVPADDDDIPF